MSALPRFARRSSTRRSLFGLIAVAAIVALLSPLATGAAGMDLAGWQPDHAHLSVAGAVGPHSHPYDHEHPSTSGAGEHDAPFAFGHSEHLHGSGSATSLPPSGANAPGPDGMPAVPSPNADAAALASRSLDVATPPPRA